MRNSYGEFLNAFSKSSFVISVLSEQAMYGCFYD